MPSINEKGRETDKVVLPDDAVVVPPHQAQEYGYWGVRPDTTPQEEHTFAGALRRQQSSSGEQQAQAPASDSQQQSQPGSAAVAEKSQQSASARRGRHGTEENR